ncbi:unnamed protein product [Cylicocyclus nassatus]|uniref:Uncharacterized protein n=1 Tax=Cylicocyclus nassatus TaxID=53992 RepID=A0AA36HBG9_CYLNA|nr:unnamed protein product [Cylicocyclus nassatus]
MERLTIHKELLHDRQDGFVKYTTDILFVCLILGYCEWIDKAKVSLEFWKYFISAGRNYKQNNKDVRISREQALKVSETEEQGEIY